MSSLQDLFTTNAQVRPRVVTSEPRAKESLQRFDLLKASRTLGVFGLSSSLNYIC